MSKCAQVRLTALQEANDALTADAAHVPEREGQPSSLGRSIQDAMAMLQDSPILRERSRNITNVKRPAFAGAFLDSASRGINRLIDVFLH